MTRTTLLSVFLSLALVPACTVGDVTGPGAGSGNGGGDGSGDGDGDGTGGDDVEPGTPDAAPEPEDYALTLDETTADLNLGEQAEFAVTLSSDNFEGPVTLSLAGAPESWEVAFSPSDVVDLGLDEFLEVTITINVPTDGEAGSHPLALSATAEPGLREGQLSVNVANTVLLPISDGTGNGQHAWPAKFVVNQGTLIRFVNRDTQTAHRIHSDSFPHQENDMGPAQAPGEDGGTYDVTANQTREYTFYCHNHDAGSGVGSLQAVAP